MPTPVRFVISTHNNLFHRSLVHHACVQVLHQEVRWLLHDMPGSGPLALEGLPWQHPITEVSDTCSGCASCLQQCSLPCLLLAGRIRLHRVATYLYISVAVSSLLCLSDSCLLPSAALVLCQQCTLCYCSLCFVAAHRLDC